MCLYIKIHTKNQVVGRGSVPTATYTSDRSMTVTMSVWMLWPMQTVVCYICHCRFCFFFLSFCHENEKRRRKTEPGEPQMISDLRRFWAGKILQREHERNAWLWLWVRFSSCLADASEIRFLMCCSTSEPLLTTPVCRFLYPPPDSFILSSWQVCPLMVHSLWAQHLSERVANQPVKRSVDKWGRDGRKKWGLRKEE